VRLVGLRGAADQTVWKYARENGFILVSKDDDFRDLSFVHGAPPKVILLAVGNDGTQHIAQLLQSRRVEIEEFVAAAAESLLLLRSKS
jgi:predicted nuclease of predicted toxin-antitoxin system